MITYNDIYEALRKEKYAEQLQPISPNFIQEIASYLNEKREISEKKDDIFSDAVFKTKKQFENAISIFKDIMRRRKEKLLRLAFVAKETGISKRDFENMMEFEKDMFDEIVKSMEDADKKVSELMNGQEKQKNILVTFKDNVAEFLDVKGEVIGPFDKGEMANLPEEIVQILREADKVKIVERN
ncbi:MAG: hypothetical protein AABX71_01020 [Nanoarchaeota archaeon]